MSPFRGAFSLINLTNKNFRYNILKVASPNEDSAGIVINAYHHKFLQDQLHFSPAVFQRFFSCTY